MDSTWKYLLLAEFSVRTVNYGPIFFPSLRAWAIKIDGKKTRIRTFNYSTDRKKTANEMFIIWLLPVWETGNKCRTYDLTVG